MQDVQIFFCFVHEARKQKLHKFIMTLKNWHVTVVVMGLAAMLLFEVVSVDVVNAENRSK